MWRPPLFVARGSTARTYCFGTLTNGIAAPEVM